MGMWKSSESRTIPVESEAKVIPVSPSPIVARSKNPSVKADEVNRIAEGTRFIGDFASCSDIRIDGSFEGRLYCEARVVVGEKATIKGDIFCSYIDFNGTMLEGNFYVKETLSLKSGCMVKGDMYFNRLQVELDARFTGKCQVMEAGEFSKIAASMSSLLAK